jgi:hypothetical protein
MTARAAWVRFREVDPGIVVAIVTGAFLLLSALVGFRSKREEQATSGLQTLITGLQAEQARNTARIAALEAKQDHLELALEARDSEIDRLKREAQGKDAEILRLTLLSNGQAARLVELEVAHGTLKGTDTPDPAATLWLEVEGTG